MTTITRFTKEQLIARINKQIDINATIIERLGDDSAAVSELAVKTATMDMKILDAAAASLTAPPVYQAQYGNDWRDVERAQYDDHAAHGSPVRIVYAAPPASVSVPVALNRLRSIVADPRALPRRKEWISGQQYSYVLLENVEAMVDDACRAAMLQGKAEQPQNAQQNIPGNIPDGYALVPIDATRAMIDAAARVEEDGYDAMHKAMIAAAPQQEVK